MELKVLPTFILRGLAEKIQDVINGMEPGKERDDAFDLLEEIIKEIERRIT